MRKPLSEDHKRRMKEGGGKGPRKKRGAIAAAASGGRFSCDEIGNVVILEPDLKHGVELDLQAAMLLCHFLQRSLPWPIRSIFPARDMHGAEGVDFATIPGVQGIGNG